MKEHKNKEIREKVQLKSKELGHCICTRSVGEGVVTCPCHEFIVLDVCKCAGETISPWSLKEKLEGNTLEGNLESGKFEQTREEK